MSFETIPEGERRYALSEIRAERRALVSDDVSMMTLSIRDDVFKTMRPSRCANDG